MKNSELFTIQDNVLLIKYQYQDKERSKKFLICDTSKIEKLRSYLTLTDAARVKKNCEELVENGVLDSRDSILEELVS